MPAKFSLLTMAALPLIPVALACGGDDGGGRITVNADSGGGGADSPGTKCTANATYGDVLAGSDGNPLAGAGSAGMPGGTGMAAYSVSWAGRMDPNAPPDLVELILKEGKNPYGTAIEPGTVQLTGEQTDWATCGACALIITDVTPMGDSVVYTDVYLATGGTLTLTSVTDTIEGTITNATFTHVVASGTTLVKANDGCDVSMPMVTIDSTIAAQMGTAAGKGPSSDDPLEAIRYSLQHRTF
jgi:hypothetical protein